MQSLDVGCVLLLLALVGQVAEGAAQELLPLLHALADLVRDRAVRRGHDPAGYDLEIVIGSLLILFWCFQFDYFSFLFKCKSLLHLYSIQYTGLAVTMYRIYRHQEIIGRLLFKSRLIK